MLSVQRAASLVRGRRCYRPNVAAPVRASASMRRRTILPQAVPQGAVGFNWLFGRCLHQRHDPSLNGCGGFVEYKLLTAPYALQESPVVPELPPSRIQVAAKRDLANPRVKSARQAPE